MRPQATWSDKEKGPIYPPKEPPKIQKRALYIRNKDWISLCLVKQPQANWNGKEKGRQESPYISAKEPYISATKTKIGIPCKAASGHLKWQGEEPPKEPIYIRKRALHIRNKDWISLHLVMQPQAIWNGKEKSRQKSPYISAKEAYIPATKTGYLYTL